VARMAYEIVTFQALRNALRCKEIWVEGADRWRNPDQDLPADFEERRTEHYQALRKPLDPGRFIDELQTELRGELAALNHARRPDRALLGSDRPCRLGRRPGTRLRMAGASTA
jgi:hypothetical protein